MNWVFRTWLRYFRSLRPDEGSTNLWNVVLLLRKCTPPYAIRLYLFSVCYKTQRFITMFTLDSNRALFWASSIHSTLPHMVFFIADLILSSHVCLILQNVLFTWGFPNEILSWSSLLCNFLCLLILSFRAADIAITLFSNTVSLFSPTDWGTKCHADVKQHDMQYLLRVSQCRSVFYSVGSVDLCHKLHTGVLSFFILASLHRTQMHLYLA